MCKLRGHRRSGAGVMGVCWDDSVAADSMLKGSDGIVVKILDLRSESCHSHPSTTKLLLLMVSP